jgi:hypothetical protein
MPFSLFRPFSAAAAHQVNVQSQFERDLISERTKAGLTAAAARGRKGERKPVVTADKLQRACEHHQRPRTNQPGTATTHPLPTSFPTPIPACV